MTRDPRVPALLLSSVLLASAAGAQAPTGVELRVNSSNAGEFPSVASDPQGRFTVVWSRWNGSSDTIVGRRFDASGVAQGPDFVINTATAAPLSETNGPRVAYEANGGFVAVWPAAGSPPSSRNVLGRRYDASGLPRGPEFLVSTQGTINPAPRVSAGSGGGFVVAWADAAASALRARPYDAAGVGMAIVTVFAGFGQPDVTMTPDRGFTVAWDSGNSVWARQFDAAGVPRGPEFPVATGGNPKGDVGIASDAAGNFTVSWHDAGPPQGDDRGPFVRKFAANGTPLTAETPVSTFTPGEQSHPRVAMAPTGEAVVSWTSNPIFTNCAPPPAPCPQPSPQDGSGRGAFARRLDDSGNTAGGEFAINVYTTGDQELPAVATDGTGRFIAVWHDLQRSGIYAHRFGDLVPMMLDVDLAPTGGSNGNRVFEPGETASIEPAWSNTALVPLMYSGAASLAGPPGPTYTMVDAAASYGIIPAGSTASCRDESDCYSASIAGARPAPHWDALLTEDILPGNVPSRTWAVHVGQSFADTPLSSPFYRFVETLLHNGVTGGCGGGLYCPLDSVPREQMPVFVLRSFQPALLPPPCVAGSERFGDVPAASPYCRWIEELARRGVVAGCGGGNYCPTGTVSRETMAVYLGATLGLNPPPCGTPVFADVPASSPFCRWIEELARRGVVGGCGGGSYCPAMPVARDQMSVFLTVTFGLALYGP